MRQAMIAVAVLLAAGGARADVNWSSVVGDAITVATISPGGTCTYGGFSVTMDPVLGSTVSSNFCYPGNTGPTGATGAAGQSIAGFSESPGANCATGGARFYDGVGNVYACNGAVGATGSTGSQGPAGQAGADGLDGNRITYADNDGDPIPGMFRMDGEAAYWDGDASWAYDASSGTLQTPTVCSFAVAYYDEAGCSGDPFLGFESRNLVRCARSGAGANTYWRQSAGYTPGGSCWAWNGSSCASTGCPGASALVVSAGSAPDLSGYAVPWTVVVED